MATNGEEKKTRKELEAQYFQECAKVGDRAYRKFINDEEDKASFTLLKSINQQAANLPQEAPTIVPEVVEEVKSETTVA